MRRALHVGAGATDGVEFVGIGALTLGGSSSAFPRPDGVQEGDLLLTIMAASTLAPTLLAGWTLVNSPAGNLRIYGKIAGPAEPATYAWSGTSVASQNTVVAYRGVAAVAPNAHATASLAFAGTTDYPAPDITPTLPSLLVYVATTSNLAAFTPPPGMTGRSVTNSPSSQRLVHVAEEHPVPATATGTRTGIGGTKGFDGNAAAALLAFTLP